VAFSTDDEGVSRSDLTLEYERAVLDYNLTYSDLREIVRNSLEYSFLPKDEKIKIEADLDARFAEFERTIK
jgi:adenosine deaminase